MRSSDLATISEFLVGLYASRDLQEIRRYVITHLADLIASDVTVSNEIQLQGSSVEWIEHPADFATATAGPDILAVAQRFTDQHPVVRWYRRTRDGSAVKISDFLSQRGFHRSSLYNEFYRRVGVEDQLGIKFEVGGNRVIGFQVSRGRRTFSERDRAVLNLLRPHIATAIENAEVVARLDDVAEGVGLGIIVLGADGRVRQVSPQAASQLASYFPKTCQGALPDRLCGWLRHQFARLSAKANAPDPPEPLKIESSAGRLHIRLLPGHGHHVLALEEKAAPRLADSLVLTPREVEVLTWAGEGKTNEAVAKVLGLSVRTVDKHLENVYRKLGVQTRMAAVRALSRAHTVQEVN